VAKFEFECNTWWKYYVLGMFWDILPKRLGRVLHF